MGTAVELVRELGQFIGIADIFADGGDMCSVVFDDRIVTTFIVSDPETINVISVLGSLEADKEGKVMRRLLALNFRPRKGAQFKYALDSDANALVLLGRWQTTHLTQAAFFDDLEGFVEMVEEGQKVVESIETDGDAAPVDFGGGFIRG